MLMLLRNALNEEAFHSTCPLKAIPFYSIQFSFWEAQTQDYQPCTISFFPLKINVKDRDMLSALFIISIKNNDNDTYKIFIFFFYSPVNPH